MQQLLPCHVLFKYCNKTYNFSNPLMSMKHTNKKLIFIGCTHTTLQQNVTITNFNKSTTLDYLDMLRVNATKQLHSFNVGEHTMKNIQQSKININCIIVLENVHQAALHKCGLLLHMSHITWSVCWNVQKMAEPLVSQFGGQTFAGPRNHVLNAGAQWHHLMNERTLCFQRQCGLMSNYLF